MRCCRGRHPATHCRPWLSVVQRRVTDEVSPTWSVKTSLQQRASRVHNCLETLSIRRRCTNCSCCCWAVVTTQSAQPDQQAAGLNRAGPNNKREKSNRNGKTTTERQPPTPLVRYTQVRRDTLWFAANINAN